MAIHPDLLRGLIHAVGEAQVLTDPDDCLTYESDAQILDRSAPDAVVLPATTEEVAAVVQLCVRHGVPFLPRGAGTGLSGGAIPLEGGVVIEMARMKSICELNAADRYAVAEAGVVNIRLSRAASSESLHYAPDPSSQPACTIGGNVAENAGGPHTLKYGVTTNHTLGLEIVLPDGDIIETGSPVADRPGYDLTGVFTGSEGTFGIATRVTARLTPLPEGVRTLLAVFRTVDAACQAVTDTIGAGIIPAAMEMMDQVFVRAVEDWLHAGFPTEAGAVLIIEVDGVEEGLADAAEAVRGICEACGALHVRTAADAGERALLWKARKSAFGALGRISPSYYTHDGVIPRTRLPEFLRRIQALSAETGLTIGNVFHAGDGNLHPVVLFDARDPEAKRLALETGDRVLKACLECGGTLTGEHGVGVEKRDLMPLLFAPDDLDTMRRLREAWNPDGLCNPGKVIPTPSHCFDRPAKLETAHQAAV